MKKRVISALIALIIACPLIYLGDAWFYIFAIVVALLGFSEIINLILKNNNILKFVSYLSFLTILGINIFKNNFSYLLDGKIIGIIFLLFTIAMLFEHKEKDTIPNGFYAIGATLFLGAGFSSIIIVRNISLIYFIYLFLISILTDTFAHALGTAYGKHKINEISPNKSWEGCVGGSFFGILGSAIFYLIAINSDVSIINLVSITFLLSCLGQLGDLFFSQIKRHYKIKDFGKIMPGHGGILDRLDSILFIMLAFTYFINLL